MQKENSAIEQDLNSTIEEADIHIIRHVNQAVKQNSNKVVISNEADVVVLVLYYMEKFINEGLQKLLIRYETVDHTTYLPFHIMCEVMGANFCPVLLNGHISTGCDMTSKVETKEIAIKVKLGTFLHAFDSTDEINLLHQSKEYLVKVVFLTTKCATFGELELKTYAAKKSIVYKTITNLQLHQKSSVSLLLYHQRTN